MLGQLEMKGFEISSDDRGYKLSEIIDLKKDYAYLYGNN